MFWAIFLTVVITALFFLVLSFRRGYLDEKEVNRSLRNKNAYLQKQLDDNNERDVKHRVNRAYQDGLWDGRETDATYREILRRTKRSDYDEVAYKYLEQEKAGVHK